MIESRFRFINEQFISDKVSPENYDQLLADGWRHFGRLFFRYNFAVYRNTVRLVLPLRICVDDFVPRNSHRRNLKKNSDPEIDLSICDLNITPEIEELFDKHKLRFSDDIPASIYEFLPPNGESPPCEIKQLSVLINEKLAAISFFGVGKDSVSGIYAAFDPAYSKYGLGTFTLLKEIEYAAGKQKYLYYLGYSYEGNSFYDYKKKFPATQYFDWDKKWHDFSKSAENLIT